MTKWRKILFQITSNVIMLFNGKYSCAARAVISRHYYATNKWQCTYTCIRCTSFHANKSVSLICWVKLTRHVGWGRDLTRFQHFLLLLFRTPCVFFKCFFFLNWHLQFHVLIVSIISHYSLNVLYFDNQNSLFLQKNSYEFSCASVKLLMLADGNPFTMADFGERIQNLFRWRGTVTIKREFRIGEQLRNYLLLLCIE